MPNPVCDRETIETLIKSRQWYHTIQLPHGLSTPGSHKSPEGLRQLDASGLPRDCSGLRVLDIGTRDGFYAFEMEKRGAQVVGVDYAEPDITGFSVAAHILDSQVEYRVENVYRLDPELLGTFDLILFLGVIYHLRNPLQALDCIRSIAKVGTLLFVESEMATARRVRKSKLPLWQFRPRDSLSGDASNKWTPNLPGLLTVLEETQFEVLGSMDFGPRAVVRARAIADPQLDFFRRLDSSAGIWGK